MSEVLDIIGVDIGGSGERFSAQSQDEEPILLAHLRPEEFDGRQFAERTIDTLDEAGIVPGAIAVGVDGPPIAEQKYRSFKSGEIIDAADLGEQFHRHWGHLVRVKLVNDVQLLGHGVGHQPADTVEVISSSQRDQDDWEQSQRTSVMTISSGIGTALRHRLPSGDIRVDAQSGGHGSDWQVDLANPSELKVYGALRALAEAGGHSPIVTVEQAAAGGSLATVVEVLAPYYYRQLKTARDSGADLGKIVATDAAAGHPDALAIQHFRAGVIAKKVRSAAAIDEAQTVVLTGGSAIGLAPQLRDPQGRFANLVQMTHPDHLYTPPTVVHINDGLLAARGALAIASSLMGDAARVPQPMAMQ